ncbi:MAG: hypothetical protein CL758_03685 [Chloroflexi bacterium]|nr:hypothetical protein [Chloroflexota bacterium]|tara:strand:- start:13608 stop:13787 length:180 start_codon:yes stop_codon:yes gene_type:complete
MILLKSCPRCFVGDLSVFDDALDGKTYACLQCGHYFYDLEKKNTKNSEGSDELLKAEAK